MIKMRNENIGERSKRVNSSPYFHRGRMSWILITSKMIMWNQGNISLQKKNDSIDPYFPNETQTRQVFCVFAVFWSPRFAHVAFIFVLALDAAEEKVLLFSLQAPCLCFPRKATLSLELVSGIPWRIAIALKAKKTRRFLGLFLYDPNIKAFLMPNEWVMNTCFLSKADI